MHLYPINGHATKSARRRRRSPTASANFSTVIVCAWHDPAVDAERINGCGTITPPWPRIQNRVGT